MSRLSQATIRDVATKLVQHRFSKDILALCIEESAIAVVAYGRLYDAAKRELMASLPEGFLPTISEVKTNVGGYRHTISSSGTVSHPNASFLSADDYKSRKDLNVDWPVPFYDLYGGPRLDLAVDDPLGITIDAFAEKRHDLYEKISRARTEAVAALQAAGTTKNVVKAWPEAAPFLPNAVTKTNLPALSVDRLNEIFKLPIAEIEKASV